MSDNDGQIEADDERSGPAATDWLEDLRDCLMFLTRLPVPASHGGRHRQLSRAVRAFPIAGAIVGLLSGLALLAALGAGLTALVAAAIAVMAGVMITGGLHEDGLADVADGFGAGGTKERKLEIMRDSRIGTYGVLALVFAVLLRVVTLSVLVSAAQSVWHAPMMLIATGALSRMFIGLAMHQLSAVRGDGRSMEAGQPVASDINQAMVAGLVLGSVLLWLACGLWMVVAALLAGTAGYFVLKRSAMRHIGGQTGDVLGATQQVTEIAMLIALSATYC